eukprot:767390-Rhodomonas_salina.1
MMTTTTMMMMMMMMMMMTAQTTQIKVELYWEPFIPENHGTVQGNKSEDDLFYHFNLLRHVYNPAAGLSQTGWRSTATLPLRSRADVRIMLTFVAALRLWHDECTRHIDTCWPSSGCVKTVVQIKLTLVGCSLSLSGLPYGNGVINAKKVKTYNLPDGETPKSLVVKEVSASSGLGLRKNLDANASVRPGRSR